MKFLKPIFFVLAFVFASSSVTQAADGLKTIKMGVVLPMKQGDVMATKMIEFYRGALMAVDSLSRATGTSVNVVAFDSGVTKASMSSVLKEHFKDLYDCDFIIGPQVLLQIDELSDFCQGNNIKLVVPFTSSMTQVVKKSNVYLVTSPKGTMNENAVVLFAELFPKDNVVILLADGDKTDNTLCNSISVSVKARGGSVSTINLQSSADDVLAALSPDRRNVIVTNAASSVAVNRVMAFLEDFSAVNPTYSISVVGNNDWQQYSEKLIGLYCKYNVHIPVSYYRNESSDSNLQFDKRYLRYFRKPMVKSTPRFGAMGFDVAWYFLKALSQYGTSFDGYFDSLYLTQQPLQNGLLMRRTASGGCVNNTLRFVRYAPSGNIDILEKK